MTYVKKVITLLAFILIIGSFPSIAGACSCAERPSVQEEFERSKAVFSGKVVDIEERRSLKGYTVKSVLFDVTNTWKGVEQSQIIITTGQGHGDCGYDFTKGKEYVVYAYESTMYGAKSLVTTMCDLTGLVSSAQKDVEVLGEGQPPSEEVNLSNNGNQLYTGAVIAAVIGVAVAFILRKRKIRNK